MAESVTAHDPVSVLRDSTRSAHQRIESGALIQPLVTGRGLTLGGYRYLIRALYAYFRPLERVLMPRVADVAPAESAYHYRPRAPLLKADLSDLGGSVPAEAGGSIGLPNLGHAARILGVLYVIEGASRGGRAAARRLAGLGIAAGFGGRYFTLDTEDGDQTWNAFQALLRRACPEHDLGEIMAGAHQTFDTLDLHLRRSARAMSN